MAYYLDLFSPETYEAFSRSDRTISGFRIRQLNMAKKIKPGDKLLCYMTKLSRWIGLLEVIEGPFVDDTPVFYSEDDPFTVRFRVRTLVWLPVERAIPIHEDRIWNSLSFTKEHSKATSTWTGKLRGSLVQIDDSDTLIITSILKAQQEDDGKIYPIDKDTYVKAVTHRIRRADKDVTVTVPEDTELEKVPSIEERSEIRESTKIQALLVEIGTKMGMKIWLPRNDRIKVLAQIVADGPTLLDRLPLNYNDITMKTIEQIDVLWLKGYAIKRAFEVEHTTSIYSGILRMADLLALLPNLDIRLHIIAPDSRRDKVFQELQRPVFSLLEGSPLSERCSYLSYDSIQELASESNLQYLSDSVLEKYEEFAED